MRILWCDYYNIYFQSNLNLIYKITRNYVLLVYEERFQLVDVTLPTFRHTWNENYLWLKRGSVARPPNLEKHAVARGLAYM